MIRRKKEKRFTPDWSETPPLPDSYRSIFKWGHPERFKHPNQRLYELIKDQFALTDDDFRRKQDEGREAVRLERSIPQKLTARQIQTLRETVGPDNIATDDYSRVRFAFGKTVEEAISLRHGKTSAVADAVVHPRNTEDVCRIAAFCHDQKIPLHTYGGGSSVTLGLRPETGGITLAMGTHMNRFIELNETNRTATVESGMTGPAYENHLNDAPQFLNANRAYTCGHFPQSFEFSTVGGWIMARGSGQQSTYYGDACDLVMSMEVVTPAGVIRTLDYPSTATGPMINEILKGSEGAFGVLTRVTMKIFRHMPENRRRFSFVFPSWQAAAEASRTIVQGEFGVPSMLRISDPEETLVAFRQHGIEGTVVDKYLRYRGLAPMKRCLCIGHTEGEKGYSRNVLRCIRKICKSKGGFSLTAVPVKKWEQGRFSDPYLREDLHDHGIIIDTLETGVKWDNLHQVHEGVRAYIKKRPQTLCMTHCSHFYPQGTNLYFIFAGRFESPEIYRRFQRGIIGRIHDCGGSLSHHHGVGKMMAPFMASHLGGEQMAVLRALKRHFDPNGIMNPGGTLGLDGGAVSGPDATSGK